MPQTSENVKLRGQLSLLAGVAAITIATGSAVPAAAADLSVKMKNSGVAGMMVFEPAYVAAKVGDKVHFMPTDPGHNAEPIPGMMPDGVNIAGGAVGKEYVITLTKPGLYGIRCKPHFLFGMVALIKAGRGPAPNAASAAAVSLPNLAKKRMALLLAQAGAAGH